MDNFCGSWNTPEGVTDNTFEILFDLQTPTTINSPKSDDELKPLIDALNCSDIITKIKNSDRDSLVEGIKICEDRAADCKHELHLRWEKMWKEDDKNYAT